MKAQRLQQQRAGPEQAAGFAFVVVLHAALLWQLLEHRLIPIPMEAATLFVNFIAPPSPELPIPPKPLLKPQPRPIEKPAARQIVADTPVVAPTDPVAKALPPEPSSVTAPAAPPPAMPLPTGPIALATELAVTCPERTAPTYPQRSRRNSEEGTVVLRVELNEAGAIGTARVQSSSGFSRLDEAALAAVRTWRCRPAQRNGQPVSTTALQSFKFVLHEG